MNIVDSFDFKGGNSLCIGWIVIVRIDDNIGIENNGNISKFGL